MQLRDSLPAVYRSMLPPFFEREVAPEAKARCSPCAMTSEGAGERVRPIDGVDRLFRRDTKCCTFHPRLPNYLIGALLADTDPALDEGRRRVRARVQSRVGASPQWLRPPARHALLYGNARQAFGRAAALRCPFFDVAGGGCTLWPFREAVCSTWYCKHVAGADGRRLWMEVKVYLTLVEIQLSRLALLEALPEYLLAGHDRGDPTAGPLSAADLDDGPLPEAQYRALWGSWEGRELEFYRICFEVVRGVDAETLARLLGIEQTIELQVLEHLYEAMTRTRLPERLKLNPATTVGWLPDGSVALAAYSENDALALPGEAYPLLTRFRGDASVAEVREALRRDLQADLDEGVLLELHRQRVLIEP